MIGVGHFPELVIVLVFALIIFGPKRLPEMGAGLGKSLREFRKATAEVQDSITPAIAGTETRSRQELITRQPAAVRPEIDPSVPAHHDGDAVRT